MRAFKLFIAAFLLSVPLLADDGVEIIGPFSTLNNTDTSFTLPAGKAQDLLNVDLTPGGKSVKKRKGFGTAFTLTNATSPVHGVYNFYESGGSDVSLFFNDRNVNSSIGGATPTVIYSTGTNGATYQCVDSAGFAYCANTSRNVLLKTNGTSISNIQAVNSTGTMVAVTPERLVMSGFSEAPNRIDFSKANDFTTWAVGGSQTDPIQFTIVSPGSRVTHITYAHGRVYWFKDSSFGYILPGLTLGDWQVRTVNSFIGSLYNTSVFRDDILYFQGNDGHWYAWDGSNLQKLSRDIQATVSATQGRSSNSWIQTSASDWNSGSFDSSFYVDTNTVSNTIRMTFPESFTSYRDGSNSSKRVWKIFQGNGSTDISTSSVSNGLKLNFATTGGVTTDAAMTQMDTTIPVSGGTTFYLEITSMTTKANGGDRLLFLLRQKVRADPSVDVSLQGIYWYLQFKSTSSDRIIIDSLNTSSTTPSSFTIGLSTSYPALISFYIDSTKYQYTLNRSSIIASGAHNWPTNFAIFPALWMKYLSGTSDTSWQTTVDYYSVYPNTFTFQSAVKNAPSLTSWDTLQATLAQTNGTHTFAVRSATGAFSVNSSTPTNWTTVSIGAVPSVSTGTYFQVRDLFEASASTGNSVSLSDFAQNWFEGGATDKTYAIYNDNALWWAIASGAGATTNNKIAKFDLLNLGWLIYDIPMNGMLVRNQSLYFGSPSAGIISKFGDATSDNGSAINAYWKSKDFFGTSPFQDRSYKRISVSSLGVSNSSMTVTYTINGNTSTSYTAPLTRGAEAFVKSNRNLPLGTNGSTINLKFGNNAADQSFEVFGAQIDYTNKPWTVEP